MSNSKRQKIDHSNIETLNDIISLDVGGKKIKTTRTTLTIYSNSMLGIMFSPNSNFKLIKQEDGSIFIDSDPEIFNEIINCLRRGINLESHYPKNITRDLWKSELEYYGFIEEKVLTKEEKEWQNREILKLDDKINENYIKRTTFIINKIMETKGYKFIIDTLLKNEVWIYILDEQISFNQGEEEEGEGKDIILGKKIDASTWLWHISTNEHTHRQNSEHESHLIYETVIKTMAFLFKCKECSIIAISTGRKQIKEKEIKYIDILTGESRSVLSKQRVISSIKLRF